MLVTNSSRCDDGSPPPFCTPPQHKGAFFIHDLLGFSSNNNVNNGSSRSASSSPSTTPPPPQQHRQFDDDDNDDAISTHHHVVQQQQQRNDLEQQQHMPHIQQNYQYFSGVNNTTSRLPSTAVINFGTMESRFGQYHHSYQQQQSTSAATTAFFQHHSNSTTSLSSYNTGLHFGAGSPSLAPGSPSFYGSQFGLNHHHMSSSVGNPFFNMMEPMIGFNSARSPPSSAITHHTLNPLDLHNGGGAPIDNYSLGKLL